MDDGHTSWWPRVRAFADSREKAAWPARWLLGVNFPTAGWPRSGEIDDAIFPLAYRIACVRVWQR